MKLIQAKINKGTCGVLRCQNEATKGGICAKHNIKKANIHKNKTLTVREMVSVFNTSGDILIDLDEDIENNY